MLRAAPDLFRASWGKGIAVGGIREIDATDISAVYGEKAQQVFRLCRQIASDSPASLKMTPCIEKLRARFLALLVKAQGFGMIRW
jgi:hypothetical protein